MFWCVTIFTAGNIAQQRFPFSQIVCEQTNRVMTCLSAEYFKISIRGKIPWNIYLRFLKLQIVAKCLCYKGSMKYINSL